MAKEKILIADDEEHILELIRFNLIGAGYEVETATNGGDVLKICSLKPPDLILIDIMLPGVDGMEVCRRLKSKNKTKFIPIIMLTAKEEEIDKVVGFELGADDYITKPFSVRELIERVKPLIRRTHIYMPGDAQNDVINIGGLVIDSTTYKVYKDNVKFDLTLKEFELLKLLILNKGKVLTRDFLLDKVWGYEYYGETRTVDVHIHHLRQKLEEVDFARYIETVRGAGYKFNYKRKD